MAKVRKGIPLKDSKPGKRSTVSSKVISLTAAEPQTAYINQSQEAVLSFMGLSRRRAAHMNDEVFFIELIRKGLPKKVLDILIEKTGLNEDEMATILHISRRTIQRREPSEYLNPEQSERLLELTRLYIRGEEALGTPERFKDWINTKVLTLGDKKPKEFLDTSIGINMLLDELGRIEHGVYS